MLFLHYSKLEGANFGCLFPEHPNICETEIFWERMAKLGVRERDRGRAQPYTRGWSTTAWA